MKRILISLFSLILFSLLVVFIIKDNFNIKKISKKIEDDTGFNISLKNNEKWDYYPNISYQNRISLKNKNDNLIIENGSINITKNYWFNTPFKIKFETASILYKGLNFRNIKLLSNYKNKKFNFSKLNANLINGKINISGSLHLAKNKEIILKGSYKNIDINRTLKQLNIANWERVNIKISSPNFKVTTINNSAKTIIENLNGEMDILGSVFFTSTEEERFGAVFLSLLADKISNMLSLSKSINYLLTKFADEPSNISGKIIINHGILSTNKLILNNKKGKALISASLDLNTKKINGKIDLYEDDVIFLTAELNGNLENPEILVGGKFFAKDGMTKSQNIKEIFEEGIQSLVDNILNSNN
jgi:hypothetical protein